MTDTEPPSDQTQVASTGEQPWSAPGWWIPRAVLVAIAAVAAAWFSPWSGLADFVRTFMFLMAPLVVWAAAAARGRTGVVAGGLLCGLVLLAGAMTSPVGIGATDTTRAGAYVLVGYLPLGLAVCAVARLMTLPRTPRAAIPTISSLVAALSLLVCCGYGMTMLPNEQIPADPVPHILRVCRTTWSQPRSQKAAVWASTARSTP